MTNEYLSHHGVKGMKWGVRRYQRLREGSRIRKRKNIERSNYDYKKGESYKNASRGAKAARTNQYNESRYTYGGKGANRIQYKMDNEGKTYKQAARSENARALAKAAAVTAAYYGVRYAVLTSKNRVDLGRAYVTGSNVVNATYARQKGLKSYKKRGFTTGFKQVRQGREFYKRYKNVYGR